MPRSFYAPLLLALALPAIACSEKDPTEAGGAPASHTVVENGVRHAPGLQQPQQNCTSCHGADLHGGAEAPSCYSCHGARWN